MSTAAPPTIPPRPARSQNTATMKVPEIPPRPLPKRLESPHRDPYPSSPFNEHHGATLGRSISNDNSTSSLPPRPPSVNLPSIGQEGSEYADLDYEHTAPLSQTTSNTSTQTRHIGGNLPMHAPKPSLPSTTARAQLRAVTRTDSDQAAAQGFGKSHTPTLDDGEPLTRLKSKSSFSRPGSSTSTDRRLSMQYDDEHGPAELGMRVPINPNLGDVQAPSPAPGQESHAVNGAYPARRHHNRTKSGKEIVLPPGSYGLHGHGVLSTDRFEKDWYAKHPEALHYEENGYYHGIGSGRGESALSSDDLNKLVRETASRGSGVGASPLVPAYPDEQIGYLASEQYAARLTPQTTGTSLHKMHSNPSHPSIESPLRKTSFPADLKEEFDRSNRFSANTDKAIESEAEDDIVHVDDPNRRYNKVTGGEERVAEIENFGPNGGNGHGQGDDIDENDYGVPILASDEVAKEVGGEQLNPAVFPRRDRRGSAYDEYRSGDQTPSSRPSSRPGSVHGTGGLARYVSRHDDHEDLHTPLEDVEEYEPLFPDEDGNKKPMTAAERFKLRPDLKHRFPSQDIWEDAPNSHLHVATVSTPDLTREQPSATTTASTFETPEQERARKGEVSESEKSKLIPKEERLAKSHFAPHLRDEMSTRPGIPNRFPSQDIWEDTPDSAHLVTTVSTPPVDDALSPPDTTKPTIPPRPVNRSKLGEQAPEPNVAVAPPTVPSRPPKRLHQVPPADAKLTDSTEVKKVPALPDRPKPQIPARPAKKEDTTDQLTKTISQTSAGSTGSEDVTSVKSPPTPKAKPQIPARPVGNKIANLRAGFLSDLDKRLQLGPQGPPPKEKESEPEVETEKAPLSDARKGRARGPQRRKPAASPSGVTTETSPSPSFSISIPKTVWSISSADNSLTVPTAYEDRSLPKERPLAVDQHNTTGPSVDIRKAVEAEEVKPSDAAPELAPPLSRNAAGESTDPAPVTTADATPRSEKIDPLDHSPNTLAQSTNSNAAPNDPSLLAEATSSSDQKVPTNKEDRLNTGNENIVESTREKEVGQEIAAFEDGTTVDKTA